MHGTVAHTMPTPDLHTAGVLGCLGLENPTTMNKALDRGTGGSLNRGTLNWGILNRGIPNRGISRRGILNRGTLNRGISSRGTLNKAIHNKGAFNKASRYAIAIVSTVYCRISLPHQCMVICGIPL